MTESALLAAGRTLIIDCSGGACSVAVVVAGQVAGARFEVMERGHAARLVPQIAGAMAEACIGFETLDTLLTTVGPGSFTGLRVALATAKGMALALSKPLIGITTFDAFRAGLFGTGDFLKPTIVSIDSKRGSLFVQLFPAISKLAMASIPGIPPETVAYEAVEDWLPEGEWIVTGDGVNPFARLVHPGISARPAVIDAKAIGQALGHPAFRFRSCAPRPLYLRAPDAVASASASVAYP